jgi:glucose-1-phosphate cytidylyltransferase
MKVVILAGGLGTRLAEETSVRPKPMVEIGGYPILWHIMRTYARHGFNDFAIALGYKGEMIKDYFLHYDDLQNDIHLDYASGKVTYTKRQSLDWSIDLIDTGSATDTGGRVHRLDSLLRPQGTFMVTYGDGVADIDVRKLYEFHKSHGKLATVTAVRPPARYGTMVFDGDQVVTFTEKPQTGEGWINGGFFVFEPEVLDFLIDDTTILERTPLEDLAEQGQLMSYRHDGFWQCMDTLRDKRRLSELWDSGEAPWRVG